MASGHAASTLDRPNPRLLGVRCGSGKWRALSSNYTIGEAPCQTGALSGTETWSRASPGHRGHVLIKVGRMRRALFARCREQVDGRVPEGAEKQRQRGFRRHAGHGDRLYRPDFDHHVLGPGTLSSPRRGAHQKRVVLTIVKAVDASSVAATDGPRRPFGLVLCLPPNLAARHTNIGRLLPDEIDRAAAGIGKQGERCGECVRPRLVDPGPSLLRVGASTAWQSCMYGPVR